MLLHTVEVAFVGAARFEWAWYRDFDHPGGWKRENADVITSKWIKATDDVSVY